MNQKNSLKILLLTPPTDLTRSYGEIKKFSHPVPSLGLAYIAAVLREAGYQVSILDAYVGELSIAETVDEIVKADPDVLGISLLTTSASIVEKIVTQLRKKLPETLIVMGNLHASLFAEDLLKSGQADFIIHREGEYTILELCQAIEEGKNFDSILGLSFLKNGKIQHNPPRPFIKDLDELPYPAWDLFPLEKYSSDPRTAITRKSSKIQELQILASRGCPMQCTFCSSRTAKSLGNCYRMRKPKCVVDEIEYFHEKYGVTSFVFMDLSFPLVKWHALELCQELIKRGLNRKISWICEMRVKPVDLEIFQKMKESGCKKVCFGIESGNQEIIDQIRKGFTLEDVKKAVAMAKSAGLEVDGMFMLGLPGETEEMSWRTINFAKELDLDFAVLNLFVPYPGCELYDVLMKENKIVFDDWSAFVSYPSYGGGEPVYVPDGRTAKELMETQRKAMRSFYLRPKFILKQFKKFRLRDIPYYWAGLKSLISSKKSYEKI
ncbi:MAG: radical SAM protein [Patescibacteria group bacterium]|nr:radical SAM protein [Patescibacteria group bacterium]